MTEVKFYQQEEIADDLLQFVVTAARYQNLWVFSRHKARNTWDMPGGRRESGETVMQAMRRELWEETGAQEMKIEPLFVYSVTKDGKSTYGMLFFSDIYKMGELPQNFEMAEIQLSSYMPEKLTYPDIQPDLFSCVQGWMNQQSNPDELWDIYDEDRVKTGQLHRRGDLLEKGQYHLVVHVWMLNREGKFLLTKRSPNKGFPNAWESTGGSAIAGDDSLTAALREVKEETGLTLDPIRGERILTVRKSDYFRDVWLFRQDFDLNNVVLQPGETVDKMYAGKETILKLWKQGSFVPYDYLEELFEKAGL